MTPCTTTPGTAHRAAPSDAAYLAAVRAGDSAAYDELYRRHHAAGLRAAIAIAGPAMAEEHTAEAFARILVLLRAGKGPETYFRAYLCTAIRNAHINHLRRERRTVLTDEVPEVPTGAGADQAWDQDAPSEAIGLAFRNLPPRWREALWLHTVEGRPLAEVATRMGISQQATAQLTYRAREGLRLGYLAEHVPTATDQRCRAVAAHLPRYVRGTAAGRGPAVRRHLADCRPCTTAASDLTRIASALPGAAPRT